MTQIDSTTAPVRRRLAGRLGLFLLVVPLVLGIVAAPAAPVAQGDELADAEAAKAALEDKIKEQQALVAQINAAQSSLASAITATSNELKQITTDLAVMRTRITKLTAEIGIVRANYERLLGELSGLDAQLVTIEAQEAEKRGELHERKQLLAQRIREAYAAERVSVLESFLEGRSFTAMLEEMSWQLDVADQDKALAERIVKDRETLAALHETVELTRTQTNMLRQETEVQRQQLDLRMAELKKAQAQLRRLEQETKRALAAQKAAYAKLARDKANLKRALAEAAEAKRRLAAEIDRIIQEQLERGNIPSEFNGTLAWPMAGSISGEFGCSTYPYYGPGNGCEHFHNGIDIVNTCGTAVKAAGAGTVAYIGWNYADGADPAWIVVIAHSAELQTWYAHMEPRYPGGIAAGSQVKKGQVVGYEGNTGRSTGCHLHWMVEVNGEFKNPRLFV